MENSQALDIFSDQIEINYKFDEDIPRKDTKIKYFTMTLII